MASSSVGRLYAINHALIAFPLVLFAAAFVTDIIYVGSLQIMWAQFSIWLITGGLIMGGVVLAIEIARFILNHGKRPLQRWFGLPFWGGVIVLTLSLLNALIHSRDAYTSVVPGGIVLSGVVTLIAIITSWSLITLPGRGREPA
ncbi:hypothetical protein KX816_04950 [Sphingosinicellaceae bacterium]|nr:hypothetical protein KX816_04950 [Sphingosinicellaceae bacterium]